MDLNALQTFVAVVRANGFAAAARQTAMPRSTVSLRIRNLEAELGVRLFKRSTRAFVLTAEGRDLFARAAPAIAELDGAVSRVSRSDDGYAGEIRITLPVDFPAHIVAGAIGEFRDRHPNVRFEVLLTNDVLDLVAENIDIALRIGATNPQEALIKGALNLDFGLYASADYLDRCGTPSEVDAIATLIGPRRPELRQLLAAALPSGRQLPPFHVLGDTFSLVRAFVLHHHGVGLLPSSLCRAELASGQVRPVLPEAFSGSVRMHLTYPSRADLSPKVAAFAEILEQRMTAPLAGNHATTG